MRSELNDVWNVDYRSEEVKRWIYEYSQCESQDLTQDIEYNDRIILAYKEIIRKKAMGAHNEKQTKQSV